MPEDENSSSNFLYFISFFIFVLFYFFVKLKSQSRCIMSIEHSVIHLLAFCLPIKCYMKVKD